MERTRLSPAAYEARRQQLIADHDSVRDQRGYDPAYDSGRRASFARVLTSARGVKLIHKVSNRHARGDAVKEHVASVVGFALDPERRRLVSPVVVSSEERILVEFLDGTIGWHYREAGVRVGCSCCEPNRAVMALIQRDPVVREAFTVMRAFDFLIENADRHAANFTLMVGGRVGAFDHTFAFEGRHGEAFDYWHLVNPFTGDQLNEWEANLRDLTDLLDEQGPVGVELFNVKPRLPSEMMARRIQELRENFPLA